MLDFLPHGVKVIIVIIVMATLVITIKRIIKNRK